MWPSNVTVVEDRAALVYSETRAVVFLDRTKPVDKELIFTLATHFDAVSIHYITKPESKPEGKPESKPEGKPESKPEGKPESKPWKPRVLMADEDAKGKEHDPGCWCENCFAYTRWKEEYDANLGVFRRPEY